MLLALTACGAKQDQGESKKDDTGDMVKFAQCMRDNGIDMPDPETSEDGGVRMQAMPADGDTEKMDAAHNACKQYLPNGGEPKPMSPEDQDKIRKQAKCMRDKGHNWPDPNFEGGVAAEGLTLDFEDEKVKQDMKDCGFGEMQGVTVEAK